MTEANGENGAAVQEQHESGLRMSDKIVIADLRQVRSVLADWVKLIEKAKADGQQVDVPTYRAELSNCAAKLEALVHAEL